MEFADCLQNNREGILRSLDPHGDLLMYMLSEKLINYDDRVEIKGRGSRRAMAEMILELVAAKSVQDGTVKERFLRCLHQSRQQHIVALLDEERIPSEVRPMTEEHHDVILTQLVHLVQSMDPEGDLLCQLRSRGVLDDREIDRIRNQRSTEEMNEVLLMEILPLKSDAAFQGLAEALRASGQPHIADLLIPVNGSAEIPMSLEHRQFLSTNSFHLTQHLDPRYDLIPLMIQRNVISYRDADQIQRQQTSNAMNEFILRLLARKPDSAFQKFIDVLEDSCQSHVLTSCYGHNVEMELRITTRDSAQLDKAWSAIEKELSSRSENVDGNSIEGVRSTKVRLRCRSAEALRRLRHMEQAGQLGQELQEPIREILDVRGIAHAVVTASIDLNEFNCSLSRFGQSKMSEEHRRYLTTKQFDMNLITDDSLLESLCDAQVLRTQEFMQVANQLTLDQRREKLFDSLKRKPDHLFAKIKDAFESNACGAIPRRNLSFNSGGLSPSKGYFKPMKLQYLKKEYVSTQVLNVDDALSADYLRALFKKLKTAMENLEPLSRSFTHKLTKVKIMMPQYNKSTLNDFENDDSVNFELSNEMCVAVPRMTN